MKKRANKEIVILSLLTPIVLTSIAFLLLVPMGSSQASDQLKECTAEVYTYGYCGSAPLANRKGPCDAVGLEKDNQAIEDCKKRFGQKPQQIDTPIVLEPTEQTEQTQSRTPENVPPLLDLEEVLLSCLKEGSSEEDCKSMAKTQLDKALWDCTVKCNGNQDCMQDSCIDELAVKLFRGELDSFMDQIIEDYKASASTEGSASATNTLYAKLQECLKSKLIEECIDEGRKASSLTSLYDAVKKNSASITTSEYTDINGNPLSVEAAKNFTKYPAFSYIITLKQDVKKGSTFKTELLGYINEVVATATADAPAGTKIRIDRYVTTPRLLRGDEKVKSEINPYIGSLELGDAPFEKDQIVEFSRIRTDNEKVKDFNAMLRSVFPDSAIASGKVVPELYYSRDGSSWEKPIKECSKSLTETVCYHDPPLEGYYAVVVEKEAIVVEESQGLTFEQKSMLAALTYLLILAGLIFLGLRHWKKRLYAK